MHHKPTFFFFSLVKSKPIWLRPEVKFKVKKSTSVTSILREQPRKASQWKNLHSFYVFRPVCVFASCFCYKNIVLGSSCDGPGRSVFERFHYSGYTNTDRFVDLSLSQGHPKSQAGAVLKQGWSFNSSFTWKC